MTKSLTLSEKIAKLDEQVEWFYGEDFMLEKAVEKYKAAANLAKDIEKDLDELKNDIQVIDKDFQEV